MRTEILVAVISAVPALITAVVSIVLNNRLIAYKIDQLEKKVEKHNNVIERTFGLERDMKTAFNEIGEIKGSIDKIENAVYVTK